MIAKPRATIQDLYNVPDNGKAEIVNGELVKQAQKWEVMNARVPEQPHKPNLHCYCNIYATKIKGSIKN